MLADYLTFSEWYHYLLLFLWLLALLFGLKYFHKIENAFKLKTDFEFGNQYAIGFLLAFFCLGFLVFLTGTFAPEMGQSKTWVFIFYGFVSLLVIGNTFICFKYYETQSAIIRLLLLSLLMLVFFYSGLLGGLLMLAIFALAIIIFTFVKFKNILKIG